LLTSLTLEKDEEKVQLKIRDAFLNDGSLLNTPLIQEKEEEIIIIK
jgi:hypothetical protein